MIKDYYLDLNSIYLDSQKKDIIMQLYQKLLDTQQFDKDSATCIFNTLVKSGYLKNMVEENRNDKIQQLNG